MNKTFFVQDDRGGEDFSLFVVAKTARDARTAWCEFYEISGAGVELMVHECPSPRQPSGAIDWKEVTSIVVGQHKESKV